MIGLFSMFRVGIGPSSSRTVGSMEAGKQFVDDLVEKDLLDSVTRVTVDVYGSLLLTGKGHHTDIAIIIGFVDNEPTTVGVDNIPGFIRNVEERGRLLLTQGRHGMDFLHDNGVRFHNGNLPLYEDGVQIHTYNGDEVVYSKAYYSISGGFIVDKEHFGQDAANEVSVPYPFKSAAELLMYYNGAGFSLSGLTMRDELALYSKKEIGEYFAHIWQTMQTYIDRGMNTEGILPDPLRVPRRASALRRVLVSSDKPSNDPMSVINWVNMFALAVNEENAVGGRVIIALTSGVCSIVPAMLTYYDHFIEPVSPDIYIHYSMVAGTVGVPYKMNASTSGVKVGCQDEVGVVCSMAATGLAELLSGSSEQVCVAVEIGMEHNPGLTCDPIAGQVQALCIEHNAVASVKTVNAARMALRRASTPRVSLNKVIETMCETGKDMSAKYREASCGGLAIKVQCD